MTSMIHARPCLPAQDVSRPNAFPFSEGRWASLVAQETLHSPSALRILCDFDGTISDTDVVDGLLKAFGAPGWEDIEASWERGEIGSRECLTRQITMLRMSRSQFLTYLETVRLDPGFANFLQTARERNIPLEIVSDGLEQAIRFILQRHGIDDLPIKANSLRQIGENSWVLDTPYARDDCRKASANCKCAHVQAHDSRTLFVGDGSSDYCASHRVDYVLAKGKLAHYCSANDIDFLPIDDFQAALLYLIATEEAV